MCGVAGDVRSCNQRLGEMLLVDVRLALPYIGDPFALSESVLIAAVTFFICAAGVVIGKKFGTKIGCRASILGGVILIAIGFEIFISSFFG